MKSKIAILLLSLSCATAYAAGAPWFKWMSTEDRTIICNQLSPGEGWVKYQGPFMGSQCRKPGSPQ
ncbi:MAG: hypothetical protein KJ899_04280 [Gammaproteobacteria bacterium]|nr:hypothetical protein [Gammaproteobacteria bacterium]